MSTATLKEAASVLSILLLLIASFPTTAGGATGAGPSLGVVSPGMSVSAPDRTRHAIALEYAIDNPEFRTHVESLAESLAGKAFFGAVGVAPGDARIIDEIYKSAKTIVTSSSARLSFEFWNDMVRKTLEAALIPAKVNVPALGMSISIAKVATAFSVAYGWGYFFGE